MNRRGFLGAVLGLLLWKKTVAWELTAMKPWRENRLYLYEPLPEVQWEITSAGCPDDFFSPDFLENRYCG